MVDKLRALGVSTPAEGKSFFGQGGFSPKKVVQFQRERVKTRELMRTL